MEFLLRQIFKPLNSDLKQKSKKSLLRINHTKIGIIISKKQTEGTRKSVRDQNQITTDLPKRINLGPCQPQAT